ncbi:hypothetical protein ABPG73_019970, partial [Tetrahymena malaccensis]
MTFKSDRLLSFFAFLVIQTSIKAQTICVEGCLICNNSDKFNTCTQCLEGYVLDSKNNLCVYAECSDNLFYDKNQQEAKSLQSGCVAVCSAFSYQNQMSNICQSKLKCSFQKSTQQQLIDITQAKDVFVYQQNYYVIQKERSLSFYDKNQLNLIKYVSLQAKDLTVLQVNGVIFLVEVDNSISVLDIENESKNEIMSPKIIPFNLLTQITSINNRYVLAFNINYEKQSVFQILFDLSYQQFSLSNSSTLDDINQSFKIVDKWLFIQNQNIIIVKKISIINSNDILNLQIQNHFRIELEKNSEYFNILPSSQLGIYILVQDLSAYQINLVSNSYKSIEIQLNERYNIKKSKIFQIYDTDLNEQLILLTELQLIYTNLLTNQSNYIKLDLGSIKDLEIYNIWAKEKLIVLLDSYNQLQLFYFDSSSQQFVLYNKQFNLYQGTDLFLIRYQNQSSTQKEFIYELASKSDNYVQIIKNQGGALGQQKQLIKKNAITNFNLQFPITQLEKNTKLLTLYKYYMTDYYPPLIHINKGRNQIFSYDCSVETTYQIAILDESRIFKVYNFGLTLLSIYQVNSQGFLSYYVQNQKNTNIIFIMHNGQNALTTFYPSYVIIQKNRKLMSDKFLKKAIFGKQQSQLYILLTQSVMSVDIYTGFQETLFSFANPIDYQVIKFFSDFKQLFVYDKIQNTTKTIQIDNANLTYQVFDELYENIFIYENDKDKLNSIRIYSSNGDLKQIIQKNVSDCTLFKVKLACKLQKGLILIDRENLAFNELFTEDEDYANIRKFIYIGHLNFLLLQLDNNLSQILIYDIFAEQVIYKIQVNLSQLKNNNITYFQFDESQSSYVMLFDSEGKLYLSSIDQNKPYQSFINICNSCDQTLFEFISHDSLSNEIYLRINDSIYQLDYELLGIKREPMLNEPFNFFTLIQISGVLTDYLILNQDNVVFRYSQNKLKSELSVIQSNIQSIRYNQESDVLILALEYSILLYKQFQFNTNNKMDHDIYVLDEIQFQNFITDSVIITFDQKILHVNVASGAIINIIQFNITQIVTSFNINHNQDLIIIGFSDGQILQYNLAEQAVFIYDTALQNPINISIFTIQLIEISVTKQFAYAASIAGFLFQIDIINKKVISQVDLRILVKEDPNITLQKFLIDQTYQRYIFSFYGQKKVYVWNFSKNQQERNLSLPQRQSNLRIEKNSLIIYCMYQINFYRLSSEIEFVAQIKKDFIQDTILDFKLFENNIIAILLINRFELFILNGDKFNMIDQINYEYPQILSYQFDSQQNIINILVLHKAGVFQNNYNLNSYKSDSILECSYLISSQEQQNILEQQGYLIQKQKEIQTINGASLVIYENQQTYLYLQIPAAHIQNAFQQISQIKNSQFVIAPYDTQNNFIILSNDTFQNLSQSILQFSNFSLTFQNNTNLFININQNKKTRQIVFQNMAIDFTCFGTNQIFISDIEKVVFQNIKISWLNLKECSIQNQMNSLFFFYNVSEIFIYNLEISHNNFYQKSQTSIFQFQLIKNILINQLTMNQNNNLNSLMSFQQIENLTGVPQPVYMSQSIKQISIFKNYAAPLKQDNSQKQKFIKRKQDFIQIIRQNLNVLKINIIETLKQNTRAQKQCVEGCSICNNINNQSICSKCQDDYELDQKNNLCVYTKCSSNLFYEKNQSDNSILGGGCVAICSAYSYKNYQNNICQSQQKCSIQRKTYQQMNDNTVTRDFFLYKDDYYVIQKEDQISIYNRNNLKNLKNMKLEASDLQVFNVNNSIFIIGSDSSITLLDIINGSRIPKSFANMISVNTFSQIDLIDNRYVMIKNFQTETGLEFQIFYDQTSQIFSLSNSIKINFIQKKIKFIDQWLFIQSSNSIVVYKIIISKNNLNLNIQVQNHFIFQAQQNSDYLDIISSQQLGIYILVKQASAYFVDLNNNSFKSIQIDLKDKEQILKSKIFQASQSDLLVEYLIIRTNEQLIFTNLQTNSSNQIKLFNTPYFDFDISNLWGNEKQIVVLYEKVNLSFYQLDSNLQKFIELKQKYVFNYKTNNRLYQIKYENKNLSQKEDIYELVTRDDSYIQIIKKESNPSLQEKQLIQINVITDYVLPFPTASQVQSQNFNFSELPNFIVISYIPPLVIFLNDNQEVNFYDYSDVTNLQFQKQLKISSNLLTLQKFSNNKIIALEPTMGYIIDIYTKNVVNIFYTDHCQYSSNSDYLATIYQNCLIIQSLEMKILFNNCKTEFKDLNFNLYLNYDLKIMTQEKSGQYISVYQIDLQSQSLQYLNTITNVKLFQIVKSFTSFEDEINNKFSIDQIVIIDQNDTFQIYDFSLSLIFQMNSLKVSQIKSVNQVVNDNQVYIVSGYEGILLINISFNTQKLIKSDLKLYGHSQIQKKLNQNNQIQYQKLEFYSTTIAEYTIDNDQNKVFEAGIYQVNQSAFLSNYIQNVKNSKINQINYFGNDSTKQMFTSYVKKQYSQLLLNKIQYIIALDQKNGKLYLYSYVDISIILLDIYTGYSKTLYTFQNQIRYLEIKLYEEFLLASDDNNIFLINIQKTENYVKKNFKVNNIDYVKEENVIYANTLSTIFILDTKLNVIQEFFNYTQDLTCILFKRQIVCYSVLPQDQFSFFLIIDKASKNYLQISNEIDYSEYLFDYEYENIFVFPINISILKIYSPDGSLKQILEKIKSVCRIFTSNILCESEKSLLLIDRVDFRIKSKIKNVSFNLFKEIEYIESLNYLIFQPKYILSQITVYDISTKTEINQIRIQKQEQIKDNRILQFKVDFILNLVMFIDLSGTFYLSSIDPQFPFYSYFKIYEPYPSLQPSQFKFDILSNNIYFIYQANVYVLDYYLLGQQNEPQLNEPYNLFTQIYINSLQIDYLILSQGSLLFRYSQQKLSFELSIIKSRMLDVKYNQKSDVLILGLVDSILFYQQYQSSKNKNFDPIIYQLDMIQFQQFILDSVVITYDHQILHLNILTGAIINKIQFNVTQIVTSFNINKSQDLIIIGFSDGQLLQYNLQSQTHFLYDTTQKGPLNTSIFFIQIIEISNVEQFAYAVTNSALLLQIDMLNKKIISKIDLRALVKEDPNIGLSKFLIDQNYQRYMFCFRGQKNLYVWNFSNNQQEAFLPLPKTESYLRIEQNYLFIQCSFQINLYRLNTKIEQVSLVKKNLLKDTIIDFKLFVNNTVALLLIDRFELFVIEGDKFKMIAQISYQYPRIMSYSFDSNKNMLHILGLHKAGVFQNSYNLDIHRSDTLSECSFFYSVQEQQNIIEEQAFATVKKNEIQTLNGISLTNQDNYYIYNYIQVPPIDIQNTFLQISQQKNSLFVIAPYDVQNNLLALSNNTFQNISLTNLYDNIGSNGAQNLGSALAKCTNVSELTLNIDNNQIGDEGVQSLGSELAKCTNLSNLELHLLSNEIGEEGASGLGSGLANCMNLSDLTLHLSQNQIGDEGASGLGSGLAKCNKLQNLILYLSSNEIGENGASELGSGLSQCTNLQNLTVNLDSNEIGDEGISGLCSDLGNCTNLSNLALNL